MHNDFKVKRILYLSDYQLCVLQAKGKSLTEIQRFQLNNNGEAEFANYLSNNHKTPIYWIIDSTQEDSQVLTIPHVVGKDHRHVMNQRMKRLFDDTTYTYGVVQSREKLGRRDDQVLLTALNNPASLQPWLNLIITFKVPLVGIYSIALLTEGLLKYFPKAPYTLLVAQTPQISSHTSGGLRQSFFVNNKLKFSRLIPLNTLDPAEYAQYVLTQITTTQRYLENARLLPVTENAEPLSVILLTDTAKCEAFQSLNTDRVTFNKQVLDNHALARRLGLQFEQERGSQLLYLHHFVAFQLSRRWIVKNHYAHAAERRYFFYRRLRIALYITSALLVSGAVAASAMILKDAAALKQKGEKTAERIIRHQAQLALLREQAPPNLPLDILLIRNIVDIGSHLEALHILPQQAWYKLSLVLNTHPYLFIEQLKWGIGPSKKALFQDNANLMTRVDENSTDELDDLEDFDPDKHFIEGIRLQGKIEPFKGNYQQALYIFTQFIKALREQGDDFWKIEVLSAPYNPNKKLQGQIGSPAQIGEAPFVIDILIKHAYI
ncbi:MAG: hypothetical protein DRR16_31430 [Candidatus Parabeggiatoa sp. nov. 3]|nr:MAG: hypothetical protein DRR16_31430 [Gammaproteobacteria bacterium]